MKKVRIVLEGFECLRCSHKWVPDKRKAQGKYSRSDGLPAQCPKCRSPYWLTPRDPRYKKVSETQKKRRRK
jgi:DNA-directed RNA polymerase subunit RPC12/RpoP